MTKNHFDMLLSLDGAKKTQDYNRPCRNKESSFDLIYQNLEYLLEKQPDICFRATIYHDTVKELYNNYLFAELLGFKEVAFIPDLRATWTQEELEEFKTQYNYIYCHRLNQLLNGKTPLKCGTILQWYNYMLNYVTHNENSIERIIPERCGLGTISCSIAYDGNIYGCQEQPSKDEKNLFLIGNIYQDGINIEKHSILLKQYSEAIKITNIDNPSKCEQCQLNNFCNASKICPSQTWDLTQSFNKTYNAQCAYFNILYQNSILVLTILSKVAPINQNIKKYLDDLMNLQDKKEE